MGQPPILPIVPDPFAGFTVPRPLPGAPDEALACDDLSRIPECELTWFWLDRIPRGRLTIFRGPPGCGKSLMLVDVAARVTREFPMPGQTVPSVPKGNVALVTCQENVADTLRPRLVRAGADLARIRRVHRLEGEHPGYDREVERRLTFPFHLTQFAHEILDAAEPELIIFDPLSDFCPNPRDLPAVIDALDELARKYRIAILATLPAQVRKTSRGGWHVTTRWNDERARSVWNLLPDPKHPGLTQMHAVRLSMGPLPKPLAYKIADGRIAWDTDPRFDPEPAELDADEARRWLRERLSEGEQPARALIAEAAGLGWSKHILRSVRDALHVKAWRKGFGPGSAWIWALEKPGAVRAIEPQAQANGTIPCEAKKLDEALPGQSPASQDDDGNCPAVEFARPEPVLS
jgi:hypothetical protein